WPKGTDCKSAGDAFGGSNPPSPTKIRIREGADFSLYFNGFRVSEGRFDPPNICVLPTFDP
ncbi:MAG: hypothetical protein II433_04860, partial [Acidaminococcaceae bacterium]|nr:hypothetical protein [Acidaminococcaceae bacterium]